MTKTAVVLTCAHSDPSIPNNRFDWLGEFLYDVRPDYVIDLGDGADLKSLNSFDTRLFCLLLAIFVLSFDNVWSYTHV